jgi:FixJ family two-component response regulator
MTEQRKLPAAGLEVVIVDDDLAVRNSLEFSLEIEGLTVRSHASGAELLEDGDLARCDCLVIDQKLADMSGLDLIGRLRERRNSVPAILITSQPSLALRERARRAGVPIVEKPLLGNALLETIRAVVRGGNG